MLDLLVLSYHGVSETWPSPTSVKPVDFVRQLSGFVRRGYCGATLSDALTAPAAEKTLVVTFDDAHWSVLESAAPAMARLGIPGTVYVPTEYASSERPMAWDGYDMWLGTEHEGELRCMSWDDLRGLAEDGWEVGSHTRSHPHLSRLGDDEIAAELTESRRECEERLGMPCRSIAYPYSDYDTRVLRMAGEAGYRFGVMNAVAPRAPLPLEWPRVGVHHPDSARRVRLRAALRRLRPSVSARAALALRGLLR
jgi:peptidoglycan/xylan/chitin deacetylase (PgdA/CDA1 family)